MKQHSIHSKAHITNNCILLTRKRLFFPFMEHINMFIVWSFSDVEDCYETASPIKIAVIFRCCFVISLFHS